MPRGSSNTASAAITSAPTTPPAVPLAVIPPDAPRLTRAPVVMRRGANGEKAPSSVAQGSAAAAASAPGATHQAPNSAATAATPPFAMTCRAVRRGARRSATCVRRLRSKEHTSELQSHHDLVCRLLLEKKKEKNNISDDDVGDAGVVQRRLGEHP